MSSSSAPRWPGCGRARHCAPRASAGPITLIGAETHLPYDRPPLSKKLLAGEWEPDRIAPAQARRPGVARARPAPRRAGRRARPRRPVRPAGRRRRRCPSTGWSSPPVRRRAGCPTRPPPPASTSCARSTTRSRCAPSCADGDRRVVVIGAGFIGLEVAATARAAAARSPCSRALPAPLIRGLGAEMGAAVAAVHEPTASTCAAACASPASSDDGRPPGRRRGASPADVVVVGIGVAPATGWLEGSGLELRDGVVCDATLAAGPPGRLRRRRLRPLAQRAVRRGDARRALDQRRRAGRGRGPQPAGRRPPGPGRGLRAGAVLLERPVPPPDPVPRPRRPTDAPTTTSRSSSATPPSTGSLALYGRGGRLRGVLGVNVPAAGDAATARCSPSAASWDDALAFAATQQT